MKKILFHLVSLEQGGTERVVTNLANYLSKNGYSVVVTTQWEGKKEFVLEEQVKRIHVGADKKAGRIRKACDRVINLRQAIKDEKPDVVISFLKKSNYRALLATMGTSIPNIIAVRNDPMADHVSISDKVLIPLLYSRAEGAVFQTEQQKEFFSEAIQKRAEVILNPVNSKYLLAEAPEKKEKVVVHSGRLVQFKNHAMLVRAFVKVHEKHPEYKLFLYGRDTKDGTREKVEALISENNATEYIKLMGSSNELEKLIPQAEIYVLSSDYEGMPNALIEAMVMGMPVVSTDCPCGGPGVLIKHEENGLLVPVRDEKVMASSICRLIENPDFARMLGKNASKLAERVNEDAIAGQWKEYIERIITQNGN